MLPASSQTAGSTASVVLGWDPNPETQVTGYKVHYGTQPGVYTQVVDVGPNTQAQINNLVDRMVYYCTVSAYSSTGVQSPNSPELAVVSAPAPSGEAALTPRLVLLDAESGTLAAPLQARSAGGDSWVELASAGSGAVTMTFNAAVDGNYSIWCRLIAPTASDSLGVSLDGAADQTFAPNAGASASPDWVWRRLRIGSAATSEFPLRAGSHTLRLRTSTMGVKIDRIVLAANPSFVPTDSLPHSGEAIAVVGASATQTTLSGAPIVLQVDALATGPLSYQWMKNGALIPGATGPTLSLPAGSASELASYSVNLWTGALVRSTRTSPLSIRQLLEVRRLTRGANQTVTFLVDGVSSGTLQVYGSNNLSDWTLLATAAVSNNQVTVSDTGLTGTAKRFYRLQLP